MAPKCSRKDSDQAEEPSDTTAPPTKKSGFTSEVAVALTQVKRKLKARTGAGMAAKVSKRAKHLTSKLFEIENRNGDKVWEILDNDKRMPLEVRVEAPGRPKLRVRNRNTQMIRTYNHTQDSIEYTI